MGGGMGGGMGGMPPEAMEQMASMLENPQMQSMMETMMSNPAFIEQQIANNPMLAGNPQLQQQMRDTMSNPQMRQAVSDSKERGARHDGCDCTVTLTLDTALPTCR